MSIWVDYYDTHYNRRILECTSFEEDYIRLYPNDEFCIVIKLYNKNCDNVQINTSLPMSAYGDLNDSIVGVIVFKNHEALNFVFDNIITPFTKK